MKNNLDLDDYSDDYPDMPEPIQEKVSSGAAAAPLADKKEDDTSDEVRIFSMVSTGMAQHMFLFFEA